MKKILLILLSIIILFNITGCFKSDNKNIADVNSQDKKGEYALIKAINEDKFEIAELLINKGAEINITDKNMKTPLMLAVEKENQSMIRLLLEKGADINSKDKNENTPLLKAIEVGNSEIVRILVENNNKEKEKTEDNE